MAWPSAIRKDLVDGRVLLYEEDKGVRIVADDVHFSNECKLDANEEYLYVVQTCGRSIARYKIATGQVEPFTEKIEKLPPIHY